MGSSDLKLLLMAGLIMKLFIVSAVLLAGVAMADPGHGHGHGHRGHHGKSRGYGYRGYYGKREAEPEATAALRPTPRLMLMPTTEATMEAMALAMVVLAMAMEDTDLATATEAMVDTVWDSTERERPSLVMDMVTMARGGVMDTEPEATTMARGRLSPVTTRTGAMATGPGVTMVMAMVTVSTTDK